MLRCQLGVWLIALLTVLSVTQGSEAQSRGGWSIGVRVGGPLYGHGYHGHHHYHGYYGSPYYYAPRVIYAAPPLVYAAPPVVYAPAPIVVRQPPYGAENSPAPTVLTVPSAPSTPPLQVIPARNDSSGPVTTQQEALLARLNDSSETVRREAAMDLGRLKSQQAIDPLVTMLAKDTSPIARDAAARGLGLIGSQRGLNALIYAAQADADRDVRNSAQFAVEIIRANLRGN